jgi:formamidopyrimidine-DNA glycosylase
MWTSRPPVPVRGATTAVVWTLDDGCQLRFEDTRKFGRVWLVDDPAQVLGELGPEPLAISPAAFAAGLAARARLLKPLLLDQTFLAGVGNIYSDEALWAARLHPRRRARTRCRPRRPRRCCGRSKPSCARASATSARRSARAKPISSCPAASAAGTRNI